jgi:hypothetical protein
MTNQQNEDEDSNGVVIWSPSTKQLTVHYNTNNSNNNNLIPPSPSPSRTSSTWKRTLDRILKRTKPKKILSDTYDFNIENSRHNGKHVHWIDDDESILNACHRFVEHLKLFVQNVLNDKNDEIYLKNCQISLDELNNLTDCEQLKQAFQDTIQLAKNYEKNQLLQQQTFIAHLISRTVLSS